jgi:putative ABC transport system substrate-binding protein
MNPPYERRKLLLALGLGTFWAALPSLAQQTAKVWRIGYLTMRSRPASLDADYLSAFPRGLRELGYVEGKNIVIEWRFADGDIERLPGLLADLARLKVDVIAAVGAAVARAAQQATGTIPIVMVGVGDPVGVGLVASLSKPGKNITGLSNLAVDVSVKSLEFLRVVVPKLSRVALLLNPSNPIDPIVLKQVQAAAKPAGISVSVFEATSASQIDAAFAAIARSRPGALIVAPDPYYISQARQIAELAAKSRLPAIYSFRQHAEAGGLMSYGENLAVNHRRAAPYVDKILKGAKPADLPVEQPTQIELIINRKTAKALGLTLPQELLLRADEVIE